MVGGDDPGPFFLGAKRCKKIQSNVLFFRFSLSTEKNYRQIWFARQLFGWIAESFSGKLKIHGHNCSEQIHRPT